MSLPAGQSWSIIAAEPTAIEIPGVVTARVTPGATALDIHAKYAAAQQELAAALAAGEVADLAAARPAISVAASWTAPVISSPRLCAGLCGDERSTSWHSRLGSCLPTHRRGPARRISRGRAAGGPRPTAASSECAGAQARRTDCECNAGAQKLAAQRELDRHPPAGRARAVAGRTCRGLRSRDTAAAHRAGRVTPSTPGRRVAAAAPDAVAANWPMRTRKPTGARALRRSRARPA